MKRIGWRPEFIREIREQAEAGDLLRATHELLERDNVSVVASGFSQAVRNHSGGMLFVGNHDKQFEFVALMSFLHQAGRSSLKNMVKFYVENQIDWALGPVGTDAVLPLYPRLLATDRSNKFNSELGSRILFRSSLLSAAESAERNKQTLSDAAAELSVGGAVNIFPCGSITNNMKKPWRHGVGRIIGSLPKADYNDVLVVPYHANSINRARLLAAVMVRGRGILARPQCIDIEFGQPHNITEIMNMVPEYSREDPAALTDVVRRQYCTSFE